MADIIRIIDRIALSAARSGQKKVGARDTDGIAARNGKADVLLFTGVRYERLDTPQPAGPRASLPAPARFLQIPVLTDLRQP